MNLQTCIADPRVRLPDQEPDPGERVAVLVAAGEDSPILPTVESILRLFGGFYRRIIFLTVGIVDHRVLDVPDFRSGEVAGRMREEARRAVASGVDRAERAGLTALTRIAIGTDLSLEIETLALEVVKTHPSAMFFIGTLVIRPGKWWHGLFHGWTAGAVRRRLEKQGLPVTMLPVVLPMEEAGPVPLE